MIRWSYWLQKCSWKVQILILVTSILGHNTQTSSTAMLSRRWIMKLNVRMKGGRLMPAGPARRRSISEWPWSIDGRCEKYITWTMRAVNEQLWRPLSAEEMQDKTLPAAEEVVFLMCLYGPVGNVYQKWHQQSSWTDQRQPADFTVRHSSVTDEYYNLIPPKQTQKCLWDWNKSNESLQQIIATK